MMNPVEISANTRDEALLKRAGPCRSVSGIDDEETFIMTSRIAKGDEAAFNQFYRLYFNRVHRYLLVKARGWEDGVNDALQDAMIRFIRHMKPFHDAGAFWNWLRRIARSALIDQARKRRNPNVQITPLTLANLANGRDEADPSGEMKNHLARSLEGLEGEDRTLIEDKYFHDKSYSTLAQNLGITAKAVEGRLARVRKKLKDMILEQLKR